MEKLIFKITFYSLCMLIHEGLLDNLLYKLYDLKSQKGNELIIRVEEYKNTEDYTYNSFWEMAHKLKEEYEVRGLDFIARSFVLSKKI